MISNIVLYLLKKSNV